VEYLIVSRSNGFGLDQDVRILRDALGKIGINAEAARPRDRGWLDIATGRKVADRIIHVERVHWRWLGAAPEHFVIPNQERFPPRILRALRRVDRVLAKTRHAEGIFSDLGLPTTMLGFASRDCQRPGVDKNWSRYLHIVGRSTMKGTDEVIAAWAGHPEWPELVIVEDASRPPRTVPDNVTLINRYMDEDELRALQNGCGIHLCPSRSEGWGHYIHEAMSCGALVITTDAPPMNEFIDEGTGIVVPFGRSESRHLGQSYFVDTGALAGAIEAALAMPGEEKASIGAAARRRYEKIDKLFQDRIAAIFGPEQSAP
jgi:glycosyltransferase involved in cell wall biosynthesis